LENEKSKIDSFVDFMKFCVGSDGVLLCGCFTMRIEVQVFFILKSIGPILKLSRAMGAVTQGHNYVYIELFSTFYETDMKIKRIQF